MPKDAVRKITSARASAEGGDEAEAKRAEADELDEKAKAKRDDAEAKRADAEKCEAEADGLEKDDKKEEAKAKRAEAREAKAAADDMDAAADDMESEAKAKRADADEPADDEDEPDGDDKAMALFRAALGVTASAGGVEMFRAFRAKFTGLDAVATLRREVRELKARDADRSKREINARAERAADAALAEGRQESEKRDLLVEIFAEAEMKKAGDGQKAVDRHLFPKGTFGKAGAIRELSRDGAPVGSKRGGGPGRDPGSATERTDASGGGPLASIRRVGNPLVDRAKALMKENPKLSFDQASKQAYDEDPSLYS